MPITPSPRLAGLTYTPIHFRFSQLLVEQIVYKIEEFGENLSLGERLPTSPPSSSRWWQWRVTQCRCLDAVCGGCCSWGECVIPPHAPLFWSLTLLLHGGKEMIAPWMTQPAPGHFGPLRNPHGPKGFAWTISFDLLLIHPIPDRQEIASWWCMNHVGGFPLSPFYVAPLHNTPIPVMGTPPCYLIWMGTDICLCPCWATETQGANGHPAL